MAICEKLVSADISVDCSNPMFAGVEQLGYLINRGDIASITRTGNVVEQITLETGKKAYQVQQIGTQPFNGTADELAEGEIMNTVNKTVQFVILDNSTDVAEDIVDPLLNGEYVFIIENKFKVAAKKNAFEIIGLDRGCKISGLTRNKYENMGAWTVTMVESETPTPATFIWKTDYDTTKAAVTALLTPAS